ncbi:FAD binding domain-containing protein [Geodermatophilus sp. SYSU D00742]
MLVPRGCTYTRPVQVADAVAVLVDDEDARPVAGGIALTLLLRSGFAPPGPLVDLGGLRGELGGIEPTPDGGLRLGALATLRDLELSPHVAQHAPVLVSALRRVASIRIRNTATIGGHVAHADPHQDLPPVLLALGAEVEGTGPDGDFVRPLGEVLSGYYETTLGTGELITALRIPPQPPGTVAGYTKTTARTVEDWPAAGVAVSVSVADGVVSDVAVAVGAVTDRAERRPEAERMLVGTLPTAAQIAECAEAAADGLDYASDQFGSADYKQTIVRVSTRRLLEGALSQA